MIGTKELDLLIEVFKQGSYLPLSYLLKSKLYDYQTKIVMIAYIVKRILISTDTGTGKTFIALALIQLLKNIYPNYQIIYILPLEAVEQTKRCIEENSNLRYRQFDGSSFQRFTLYNEDIILLTFQSLFTSVTDSIILDREYFKVVIVDESASRANDSLTHRIIKAICNPKYVEYCFLLTATPLRVSPVQMVNQINILYPDFIKNPVLYIKNYEIRDCDTGELIGYHNLTKLEKKLGLFYISDTRKDLGIKGDYDTHPLLIDEDEYSKQANKNNYLDMIKANPQGNSIKALTKLVQDLTNQGLKGIVYAYHHRVKDLVYSSLVSQNIRCDIMDGRKTEKEKSAIQEAFNNDLLDTVILNITTAKNLSCDYIIFYELTSDFKQVIGRGERGLNKKNLKLYFCLVDNEFEFQIFNERIYQRGLLLEKVANKDVKEVHDLLKRLSVQSVNAEVYEPYLADNSKCENADILLLNTKTLNDLANSYQPMIDFNADIEVENRGFSDSFN